MKRLLLLTLWQFRLLLKYQIILMAFIIGVIYCSAVIVLPALRIEKVIIPLIFSDPGMLGFIFIGAIVLFEKADNTLPAQVITPMTSAEYLWTKALALLVPALIVSLGISISAFGFGINYISLFVGVTMTSLIFTFLGFVGVSQVKTFNQYIIIIPLFLAPAVLPMINFVGISGFGILKIIPTHASMQVLSYLTKPIDFVSFLSLALYLFVWLLICYFLALRAFSKHIVR